MSEENSRTAGTESGQPAGYTTVPGTAPAGEGQPSYPPPDAGSRYDPRSTAGSEPLPSFPPPPGSARPYPPEVPVSQPISPQVASGLAYFTVIPAIFFLLLEPYKRSRQVRFHSWQSIFYFLAAAMLRVLEQVLLSLLSAGLAYTFAGLFTLVLFTVWLIAVIRAFQGSAWSIPFIGPLAERTAANTSAI